MREDAGAGAELDDDKAVLRIVDGVAQRHEPVGEHRAKGWPHRDRKGGKIVGLGRFAEGDAAVRVVTPRGVVERVLHEFAPGGEGIGGWWLGRCWLGAEGG